MLALGCAFDGSVPTESPDDSAPGSEMPPDDPVDEELCSTWQPTLFDACALAEPDSALSLGPGLHFYDTDTGKLISPNGTRTFDAAHLQIGNVVVHAISLESLTVQAGAELRLVGKRPLLVASWSDATIAGLINLSANLNGPSGTHESAAGAGVGCPSRQLLAGSDNTEGSSGGAGGSLGEPGGSGGAGAQDGEPSTPGNPGGAAIHTTWAPSIGGGCAGGDSGIGTVFEPEDDPEDGEVIDLGIGGSGAGGFHIAALGRLELGGDILAVGAGGSTGIDFGGGGGGGSGGLVALEASELVDIGSTAYITVAGGGGGAGTAHDDLGGLGLSGSNGGLGGLADHGHAGNGGAGSTAIAPAVDGNAADDSGGGGGGSIGIIAIYEGGRLDSVHRIIGAL